MSGRREGSRNQHSVQEIVEPQADEDQRAEGRRSSFWGSIDVSPAEKPFDDHERDQSQEGIPANPFRALPGLPKCLRKEIDKRSAQHAARSKAGQDSQDPLEGVGFERQREGADERDHAVERDRGQRPKQLRFHARHSPGPREEATSTRIVQRERQLIKHYQLRQCAPSGFLAVARRAIHLRGRDSEVPLSRARAAGAVEEHFVSLDMHPFRGETVKIQFASFYFEDLATRAALEVVVMMFSRGLVPIRRSWKLDGDQVTFSYHGLKGAIHRRNPQPSCIGSGLAEEILGRERHRIFVEGFQDRSTLLGIALHG